MLRNPLASPDVIGITLGRERGGRRSRIVLLSLERHRGLRHSRSSPALGVALLVYGLAFKGGVAGTRLILIGIGVAAMLDEHHLLRPVEGRRSGTSRRRCAG